jgi:ectoine hydroxylase-related dioxygenase (phytanoyl-CoA dioxygenase family)
MIDDLSRYHQPLSNLFPRLDSLTPAQRAEFKPVAIELKAGECSFHHPLMVHGSHANQTARPRRAVVLNAFRDGVVSASNEPLLKGVPSIAAGEKMDGQFFPLLFDPAR